MADTTLATVTFNAIKAMTDPLFDRIKALEADVATLKAQAPAASAEPSVTARLRAIERAIGLEPRS